MTKVNVNRKAWHYKAANLGGYPEYCDDICEYIRMCLLGCFLGTLGVCIVGFASGFVLFLLGNTLAWLAAMIVYMGFIDPNEETFILILFCCLALLLKLIVSVPKIYEAISTRVDAPFVKTAYSSWKNKWCAKIEFK